MMRMSLQLGRLILLAVFLVAVGACDRKPDSEASDPKPDSETSAPKPDSPEALSALQEAVAQHNVADTAALLERGVDPKARAADGKIPLQTALEAIFGTTRDSPLRPAEWDAADPRLQVMRLVMRSVRRSWYAEFDETGRLEVSAEYLGLGDKGHDLVASMYLVLDSGEKHKLALSHFDTEYDEIPHDLSSALLELGGTYRVVGVVRDTFIEVERIEWAKPRDTTGMFPCPIFKFLPSTSKQIAAFTWIGAPKK